MKRIKRKITVALAKMLLKRMLLVPDNIKAVGYNYDGILHEDLKKWIKDAEK